MTWVEPTRLTGLAQRQCTPHAATSFICSTLEFNSGSLCLQTPVGIKKASLLRSYELP